MRTSLLIILLTSFLPACTPSMAIAKKSGADKEQILFTTARDGNFEVYTMDGDSTNVLRLTNDPETDYGLNWSPDGKYILFYSNRSGNKDIWRMDQGGSDPINLTNAPSAEWAACDSENSFCKSKPHYQISRLAHFQIILPSSNPQIASFSNHHTSTCPNCISVLFSAASRRFFVYLF